MQLWKVFSQQSGLNTVFWSYSASSALQIAILLHPSCSLTTNIYMLHQCRFFTSPFFSFTLFVFHIHRVYTVLLPMLYTYLILTTIWSFMVDIYLQHFAFFYFCQQICLYGGQQFNNFDVQFLEFYILYVWLIFKQFM